MFRAVTKCGAGFSDADLAALPARLAPLLSPHKIARVDPPGAGRLVLAGPGTRSPQVKTQSYGNVMVPLSSCLWIDVRLVVGRSVHDSGRTVSGPCRASPHLCPERALCPGIAETSEDANRPERLSAFQEIPHRCAALRQGSVRTLADVSAG